MSAQLKIGDEITIAGFGIGRKGQLVIDGVNPVTRRKCRSVRPARLIITGGCIGRSEDHAEPDE